MKRSRIVATALVLAVSFASAQKNETVPTASPNSTIVPTPAPNSTVPTVAPNSTVPTMAPNSTVPTMAPNSTVPTMAPNSTVPTAAPVDPPTPQPTKKYVPPVEPTAAPTSPVPPVPSPPRGSSFMKLVGRTIGWLIFLGLSVLVFGALMSNRYRIYYALRGVWYSFLRLNCTRWIIRKVRGGRGPSSNTSLNEIIFDQNDLNEGLLLNDNNQ